MKTLITNQVLKDFDGKDLKENGTTITVGLILTNQLAQTNLNPHRAFQLGRQIATEKKVELKAEDIVYLKDILRTSTLGALYVGQVIEILETKDKE